jgi:hypothetical protein
MDTSAIASTSGATAQPAAATPGYLQPQPNNPTYPGAIANMIKAIMSGNDDYKAQQAKQAQNQGQMAMNNPTTTTGGPSVGQPMSLTPPTDPATMTAGLGQTNPASAFPTPPPQSMSPNPTPAAGPMGPMTPVPMSMPPDPAFTNGASPVSVDPVTQALFSPIPGASNG